MSDAPEGSGWWMATDGKWYAPTARVDASQFDPPASQTFEPPGDRAEAVPSPASPRGPQRRRGRVMAAAAIVALLAAIVVIAILVDRGDPPEAVAPARTEVTSTTQSTLPPTSAPNSTLPLTIPGATGVSAEPAGLHCRDLVSKKYDYTDAVSYWTAHGKPTDLDIDGNGIPCETTYPSADVTNYWVAHGVTVPTRAASGAIDFSSPLFAAYSTQIANFDANGPSPTENRDIATLNSLTGISWSHDMLMAIAASYCNDWESNELGITPAGREAWAKAVAPPLGVPLDAARVAINSGIPAFNQLVCD